jgi:hypothetical protein
MNREEDSVLTKQSSLNMVMLLFSAGAAMVVYVLGEVLLQFVWFMPFIVQCGIYLAFVTTLLFVVIFFAEKIKSGNYIPRGRITFNSTCAKAAAMLIPAAFAVGLLTQLLYGFSVFFVARTEVPSGIRGRLTIEADVTPETVAWLNARPPGPGTIRIHSGTPPTSGDFAYFNLQHFFTSNRNDLHGYLETFASREGMSFRQWLDARHPTVPGGAPSFLAMAEGNEALAFRAVLEYSYGRVLDNYQFMWRPVDAYHHMPPPAVRDGYRGTHGRDYVRLWETMDDWARSSYDPCANFYSFWNVHIMPNHFEFSRGHFVPPHLLLHYSGPGITNVLRIGLQTLLLSLWGIFSGLAVVIYLNNSRLFSDFLVPRILVSVVLSLAFVLVMAFAGANISMVARLLLAFGTCLLYLPIFSWNQGVKSSYGGAQG